MDGSISIVLAVLFSGEQGEALRKTLLQGQGGSLRVDRLYADRKLILWRGRCLCAFSESRIHL